jgi:hypothetical protein
MRPLWEETVMRTSAVGFIAAIAISLTWQVSDAAPSSKQQLARGLGDCLRMANARGWNRAGEKGRLPFIRRCMQGKVG